MSMLKTDETSSYQIMIPNKYHPTANGYITVNGFKLSPKQSGSSTIQNVFYNDWKSDNFVSTVLVFL